MGFRDARAISGLGDEGPLAAQAVILARGPEAGPGADASRHPGTWLVFADRGGTGSRIAEEMGSHGRSCAIIEPGRCRARLDGGTFTIDPASPDDYRWVLREAASADGPPCAGVLYLWPLDAPAFESLTGDPLRLTEECGCRGVAPGPGPGRGGRIESSEVMVVHAMHQAVGEGVSPLAVAPATIWGLGKVIALEHPELRPTCVDLEPGAPGDEVPGVVAAVLEDGGDDQIAFRNGLRHVARLVRRAAGAEAEPVRLVNETPGVLDGDLRRWGREPGPGEVEVRVEAAALDFRDVLCSLGLYPGAAGELRSEMAGVVSAVGPGVGGFAVGDAVAGVGAGGLGSYVTVRAELLISKPAAFSFAEAATIPTAFLTAHYALHRLGKMVRGERVLIHAASGGVGLAAVQLARRAGCEVSPRRGASRSAHLLQSLGVNTSSIRGRSPSPGRSCGPPAARGSTWCSTACRASSSPPAWRLQPRGRFLEIGMRGIWDAGQVAKVRPQASYIAIDLGTLTRTDPELIGRCWPRCRRCCEEASPPLPYRVFPAAPGLPEPCVTWPRRSTSASS